MVNGGVTPLGVLWPHDDGWHLYGRILETGAAVEYFVAGDPSTLVATRVWVPGRVELVQDDRVDSGALAAAIDDWGVEVSHGAESVAAGRGGPSAVRIHSTHASFTPARTAVFRWPAGAPRITRAELTRLCATVLDELGREAAATRLRLEHLLGAPVPSTALSNLRIALAQPCDLLRDLRVLCELLNQQIAPNRPGPEHRLMKLVANDPYR